jgi:DNA-binding transcriptional LysR family regulator
MIADTAYLPTFHAVCQAGSFKGAAERLFKTQPAVSYDIKMLERQLKVPLFERMGRRLVLTEEGRRLRDFCRRFFSELEVLAAEIGRREPSLTAPLRIAAVSVFGRFVLFPLLCTEQFQNARFELRYRTAAEVFELVESGGCDIGAVYQTKVSNYLRFIQAYVEEVALIGPIDETPPIANFAEPETYESLPLITYDESDFVFGRWFQTLFGAQPRATRRVHHFEELEEVVETVVLGRGFSVVPLDAAKAAEQAGRLRVLRPTGRRCLNQEYIVVRAGAFIRDEVHALVAELRAASAPDATDTQTVD